MTILKLGNTYEMISKDDIFDTFPYLKLYKNKIRRIIKEDNVGNKMYSLRAFNTKIDVHLFNIDKDGKIVWMGHKPEELKIENRNPILNYISKYLGHDDITKILKTMDFYKLSQIHDRDSDHGDRNVRIFSVLKSRNFSDYNEKNKNNTENTITIHLKDYKYRLHKGIDNSIVITLYSNYPIYTIPSVVLDETKLLKLGETDNSFPIKGNITDTLRIFLRNEIFNALKNKEINREFLTKIFIEEMRKIKIPSIKKFEAYSSEILKSYLSKEEFIFVKLLNNPNLKVGETISNRLNLKINIMDDIIRISHNDNYIDYNHITRNVVNVKINKSKIGGKYKNKMIEAGRMEAKIIEVIKKIKEYVLIDDYKIKYLKSKKEFKINISFRKEGNLIYRIGLGENVSSFKKEVLKDIKERREIEEKERQQDIKIFNNMLGPYAKYDIGKSLLTLEIVSICNANRNGVTLSDIIHALRGTFKNKRISLTSRYGMFESYSKEEIKEFVENLYMYGYLNKKELKTGDKYLSIDILQKGSKLKPFLSPIVIEGKDMKDFCSYEWERYLQKCKPHKLEEKDWENILPLFEYADVLCVCKMKIASCLRYIPDSYKTYLEMLTKIESGATKNALEKILNTSI